AGGRRHAPGSPMGFVLRGERGGPARRAPLVGETPPGGRRAPPPEGPRRPVPPRAREGLPPARASPPPPPPPVPAGTAFGRFVPADPPRHPVRARSADRRVDGRDPTGRRPSEGGARVSRRLGRRPRRRLGRGRHLRGVVQAPVDGDPAAEARAGAVRPLLR